MTFPIKTVILSAVGTLAVIAAAGAAYVQLGIMNVAASNPDNPIVATVLHYTSDRSVEVRYAENTAPAGLDKPEVIKAGAVLYAANCAVCHSAPGMERTAVSKGMNPQPPQGFFRATRHPKITEQFWYIKNGVKMSGMPSFAATHKDDDLWALAAFITKAPGMSAADYAALTAK